MIRPPRRELVIRARWVVPMRGPPLAGGWVRIRRGRIVALGRGAAPRSGDTRLVEATDAIVMPGLVNAHTHLEFSDVETPLEAAGGLPGWIGRVVAMRRGRDAGAAGAERVAAVIRRGLEESAAHGVTAIGEIATGLPRGGYPARGPRLRVFREALGLSPGAAAAAAAAALRDVPQLRAAGTAAGLSPHSPYSVAAAVAGRLTAAARRLGVPLAMHIAESAAEEEFLRAGTGPFRELFDRLGVWPAPAGPVLLPAAEWISRLAKAPRGLVVHGTHLGDDSEAFARLARHRDRLAVAVCPRTTRSLAQRLPPVALFRDAGIRVALGTDSRASTPDLSVLAECRVLVDAGLVAPAEALRMATVDAAWALGFERLCGALAPGRPADLVILAPAARSPDPYEALLDPSTQVTTTLRAGRVIAGTLSG